MSLGPHIKHNRRDNPCPRCGKVGNGCLTFDDDGTDICRTEPGDYETPSGWHVHKGERAGGDWRDRIARMTLPPLPPEKLADPDVCDKVHRFALEYFALTTTELIALRSARVLTQEQIEHHGPFGRVDPAKLDWFAIEAVDRFGNEIVGQVPGFYWKALGVPSFMVDAGNDGLLIPVYDLDGRMIRLRVRTGKDKKKYAWISSLELNGGVGSKAPEGIYLPIGAVDVSWDRVAIVEGEFKSIAVADRWRIPVICVSGVTAVAGVTGILEKMGAKVAIIFFDADSATNKDVARAEQRLAAKLFGCGLRVLRATWDVETAKGIDDLLNLGLSPFMEPVSLESEATDDSTPVDIIQTGADCSTQLASAMRRITVLQADNERLTQQVAALKQQLGTERELVHLQQKVREAPAVQAEKDTICAAGWIYEAGKQASNYYEAPDGSGELVPRHTGDDYVRTTRAELAQRTGKSPRTITTQIANLEKMGLLDVKREPDYRVDPETGEKKPIPDSTVLYIRPRDGNVIDMWKRATTLTPEDRMEATGKKNTHGGKRQSCPECGSLNRKVVCADCGHTFESFTVAPDADVVMDDGATRQLPPPRPADEWDHDPYATPMTAKPTVQQVPIEPDWMHEAPDLSDLPADSFSRQWFAGGKPPDRSDVRAVS